MTRLDMVGRSGADARPRLSQRLRAGYCQRWHACPEMAGSESIDAHASRVAKIILYFWPFASAALLAQALQHDDGEMGLGDMAGPAKRRFHELAEVLDWAEAQMRADLGLVDRGLMDQEQEMLHLADGFAAFLHVRQVLPDILANADWQHDLAQFYDALRLSRIDDLTRDAMCAEFETAFRGWFQFGLTGDAPDGN